MKLSVNLFMTLDGVSQGPDGAEEDPRNGFTAGGWLMPYFDQGCGQTVDRWFSHCGELLLGRYTYDEFASHWPRVTDAEDKVAHLINTVEKNVVTSRPLGDIWADSTQALGPNVVDAVTTLKERVGDKEIQVHGSIRLAATLRAAGLVDTYRLLITPVVVGGGASIFADGPASGMTVERYDVTENGVIALDLTPHPFDNSLTTAVEDGKDAVIEK